MGLFKRKSSKKAKALATPAPGSESDEISLMSEDSDWAEEREALQRALAGTKTEPSGAGGDPFEHASLWADVDRDDLERIALNVARNAVPPVTSAGSEETAEAAARLNISAAVAENAEVYDSTDPLGYGRIDTRMLKLTRDMQGGAGGYKPRYAGRASLLDGSGRRQGPGRGRAEDGGAGEAPPALRAKVLPGGEQFDATLYLGTVHADTALPELLRGLQALRQQLSEHTGQLKSLVKENFDRFTSSKNTIDTVYAKLQKAEVEGEAGVHGSSTGEVLEAVQQVQDEARRAFAALLDRHSKADRIRLVLGVMQRYEALVQLPSRVRQHAEAGDYGQVVADYRKAKALLGQQSGGGASSATSPGAAASGQPPGDSMWAKLMLEIDKVAGSVAHTLETVVRSAQSTPGEALDAIRYTLQLRAVGVPAAQGMDPVGLYVSSQERHVRALLEAALAQHTAALEALRRAQRESEEEEAHAASLASLGLAPLPSGQFSPAAAGAASPAASAGWSSAATTPRRGGTGGSEALGASMEGEVVRYVSLITGAVCQWLPDFWVLTQQRLPGLAGEGEGAAAVERGVAAAERSTTVLLGLYRSAVRNVLANPAAACLTHAGLLSVAAELADGCRTLSAPPGSGAMSSVASGSMAAAAAATADPPHPGALQCVQQLTEQAVQASLEQLGTHLKAAVGQVCAAEDCRLTAASRRAGQPATASLAALQQLVQQGMQHLQAALAEAGRARVGASEKAASAARAAFFGCFSAFAAGVATLGDGVISAGQQAQQAQHSLSMAAEAAAAAAAAAGGERDPAPASPSRRLLVLCANLGAARSRVLPRQFARWAALLQASGSSGKELQAAVQACAAELEAAETRLAGAYIDRQQVVLDEVMEQLLFTGGTAWEAAPPPQGLRPVALELIHAVVATQAELAATAPELLMEALEELLHGTLEGFAQVLAQGAPATSAGGALQLWLEGTFLLASVAGLGSEALQQASARLRAALDQRLELAVSTAEGRDVAQLAAWAAGGGVGVGADAPAGQARRAPTAEACRARLEEMRRQAQAAARYNLAPLQQLAAAPR